ncbi:unnamed protein product [Lactuca saligna]|uniref:Uncharacterized protein n=1 Tax=Lactuca saligna TaxID=75948 RepID=A0AA36A3I1_LACSI|nr:unnamed protein product [Lactuca saligna]
MQFLIVFLLKKSLQCRPLLLSQAILNPSKYPKSLQIMVECMKCSFLNKSLSIAMRIVTLAFTTTIVNKMNDRVYLNFKIREEVLSLSKSPSKILDQYRASLIILYPVGPTPQEEDVQITRMTAKKRKTPFVKPEMGEPEVMKKSK